MGINRDRGAALDAGVAEAIRAERGAQKLRVKDLVERSGVPERTLVRYLNGERSIPLAALVDIADALGLDWQELLKRGIDRMTERN